MNEISELPQLDDELIKAFDEIQMARTPYQLEHFVIGQHDTEEQRYAQCVLELQIKYDTIKRAILGREKLHLEKIKIDNESKEFSQKNNQIDARIKAIDAENKQLDIDEQDRAMKGALREFRALYCIFKTFKKNYTRDDLDKSQPDYWNKRLVRQANQDMLANGRIGVGNADALRMIGLSPIPELDHIRSTEQRFLEKGDRKVLVVVPTEKKAADLPCLKGIVFPSGLQVKFYNVYSRKIAEAYNDAAQVCLKDGSDYMFCVEDDTFPPPDAFMKLINICNSGPKIIAGGWYPKRQKPIEGTPIIVKNDKRQALEADGEVHQVFTIPQGCTLIPSEVFLQTSFPWFVTTNHLTQDSFFSQLARDAGWTLLCDTSIRCKHIDRVTGEVFE